MGTSMMMGNNTNHIMEVETMEIHTHGEKPWGQISKTERNFTQTVTGAATRKYGHSRWGLRILLRYRSRMAGKVEIGIGQNNNICPIK